MDLEEIHYTYYMKMCRRCLRSLPFTDFTLDKQKPDGYRYSCRRCDADVKLQRKYGISLHQYEQMIFAQGNVCALCGKDTPDSGIRAEQRWHVDHDHLTGAVRGLLCSSCNLGIGKFYDDPDLLRKAADYIEVSRVGTHTSRNLDLV